MVFQRAWAWDNMHKLQLWEHASIPGGTVGYLHVCTPSWNGSVLCMYELQHMLLLLQHCTDTLDVLLAPLLLLATRPLTSWKRNTSWPNPLIYSNIWWCQVTNGDFFLVNKFIIIIIIIIISPDQRAVQFCTLCTVYRIHFPCTIVYVCVCLFVFWTLALVFVHALNCCYYLIPLTINIYYSNGMLTWYDVFCWW